MRHVLRLALALALLSHVARADDPTPLLPESALAYLELDGLAALPAQLGALSIWRDGCAFTTSWATVRESLRAGLTEMKDDAPFSWTALEAMAGQARRLRICLLDVRADGVPSVFVALEMASTADVVRALEGPLGKLVKSRFEVEGKTVCEFELDRRDSAFVYVGPTVILATLEQRVMRDFLAGRAPARPLSESADFKAVAAQYGSRPLWAYANLGRCLEALTSSLSRRERRDLDAMDGALDLRSLRSLGLGSTLETTTTGRAFEVTLPIPAKHALYAALRGRPLDLDLLHLLPSDPALVQLAVSFAKPEESWAAIAQVVHGLEKALATDIISRGEADIERELGSPIGGLLAALGGDQVLGISEDLEGHDQFLWAGAIRDREALDARFAAMKAAPFLTTRAEKLRSASHRDATLEFLEHTREPLTLGRTANTVLFANSPDTARTALDLRAAATSVFDRVRLDQLAPGYTKLLLLDPQTLADQERDLYFVGQLAAPGVPWIIGTEEHDDRLVLGSNFSAQSIAASLALSAYLWDQGYAMASSCEHELEEIAKALDAFRARHHRNPTTLAELDLEHVRCPLTKEGGAPGDYGYLALGGEGRYLLWCPLTLHGRLMRETGQNTTRCRERTFLRAAARLRAEIAAASAGPGSDR